MIDQHSLQVTYRFDRGEPRGAHKKDADWAGRGDCIDCNACVVACPMGIDIREGSQMECINCGLCIDACDDIMRKVERPVGLIAFDTDAAVAGRAAKAPVRYHLLRGRTAYYGVALIIVSALMVWGLSTRSALDLHVLRDRNPRFVVLKDGSIRNGYTLKIANRSYTPQDAVITFTGIEGVNLKSPGEDVERDALVQRIAPNEVRPVRVFITAHAEALHSPTAAVAFVVQAGDQRQTVSTVFESDTVRAP